MSEVHVKENESLDSALKRFKRNCAKAGVLSDLRRRNIIRVLASSAGKSLKRPAKTRIKGITDPNIQSGLILNKSGLNFLLYSVLGV